MSEDIFYFSVLFHGVETKYLNRRGSGSSTHGRRGFKCRPLLRTHGLYRVNLTVPCFTNIFPKFEVRHPRCVGSTTKNFLCITHTVEHNYITSSSIQLNVSALYVGHLQVVI